jgi:hypothetical protein
VAGQARKKAPQPQDLATETPRAALPGELYQQAHQWWWRVKLPGEDKAKARPLESEGAKPVADSREDAEKIALEVWERAVQENAVRQFKMESTEKIERLKAQFLDKVRHFTEMVETANARLQAEEKARAEAEAKLAQMVQTTGPKTQDRGQAAEGTRPPVLTPPDAIAPLPAPAQVSSRITPIVNSEPQLKPPALANAIAPDAPATLPLETGACECCGATGIARACLTHIDSGQSLCPRCLTALQADAARIDSDTSA